VGDSSSMQKIQKRKTSFAKFDTGNELTELDYHDDDDVSMITTYAE